MSTVAVPSGVTPVDFTRLHQLFEHRLQASPDFAFLLTPEATVTLSDLGRRVDTLTAELQGLGVLPGDRVLTIAENCPQHVALVLACSRLGAWSCGVNARMARGEVAGFRAKAEPRVVYFTSSVSDAANEHADHAQAVASQLEGLRHSASNPKATPEPGAHGARVAAMIFTSGTTGQPKGVMVSHAGLLSFARISAQSRQLGPQDRSYAYVPMTHIFGLATVLMASLYAGAALVMRSKFDPADLFDALAHHGVTTLQGPPAMFTRLLAWAQGRGLSAADWPALRYLYTGAAPLDLALKRAVEAHFGLPLHHGYGLSEYAGSLSVSRMGQRRDDTSAGYLTEGGELRIVDSEGRDLALGERGEIWMRGPGLMPGYFREPEATAKVMRPGGWYASGDIGYQAPDGALFVVGRLKEMIIRSGFNVYPGEVEAVLTHFPGIQRAAVVGRREEDGNETVLAFVETVGYAPLNQEALQAYLVDQLAPYKRPAKIVHLEALPMTLSGKVLKRVLLEQSLG